jgi:serine phosphatase RsbU (regulator of sigma subunit)/PAS domain-containing protein
VGTVDGVEEHGPAPDLAVLSDADRLEAVAALVALGPPDARVRELTALAARLLQTPSAQLSLLGAGEQVVAALHGAELPVGARRSPLAESLCSVTAASGAALVVPSAKDHPWVSHLPPVTSGAVGSYLGAVLRDGAGHVLGSLCVYDTVPRAWTPEQVATLTAVTDAVSVALADQVRAAQDGASTVRLELAAAAAELGSYEYDLRTGAMAWDARMSVLHGFDPAAPPANFQASTAALHPDDVAVVTERMTTAVERVGDLNLDYRVVLPDGTIRWISARGRILPDMLGQPARLHGAAFDRSGEHGLRDELTRLLETIPAGFLRCRNDGTVTFVNQAAEKILAPRGHVVGGSLWDAFPEARETAFDVEYRRARDTQTPGMVEAYFAPLDMHIEVHVWPDPAGLSFFFHDVSETKRATLALQGVSDRLTLLAGAGARLSASLSPDEVLATLASVIVPDLASSLVLAVTGEVAELLGHDVTGDPARVYVAHLVHADPELEPLLADIAGRTTLTTAADSGMGRAIRTGQPQFMPHVPDEHLVRQSVDAEHLANMRRLYGAPTLSVPIRSLRGIFGSLTVVANPGRELDELLISDLAARAAVALQNALVFVRQGREATALQRGLLPQDPAGVEGVVVATRYLPASSGSLAGGDFFKTVRVGARLVTVLGDVMGHGSVSAARAGQLHSVVAALALEGHGPAELLRRLARGSDQIMELELATLLVSCYDPAKRELSFASAGHPLPLYAPAAGDPYYLEVEPGPPIGVAAGSYEERTLLLEPGSTLVAYSDGLVERRGESITVGLERLRQAVVELRLPPEAVADHILTALDRRQATDDDVALLVMSHL